MNTLKYLTISLCSVLLLMMSCTSETETKDNDPSVKADQLNGRWDLASATRDGQETVSLEGTYMSFSGNNKMTCNFIGEDIKSDFTFKNNEITQGQQVYKVKDFSASKLVVSTTLMDFEFELTFDKTE